MRPTSWLVCVAAVAGRWCLPAAAQTHFEGPLLSTFTEIQQQDSRGPQGSYQFSFSLPQQERTEHRDEQGKVRGSYSFVDKVGEEVSVKYDADHSGFRAHSDALPQPPQDTPDVAKAKEEFLRHYERTVQLLKVFDEEDDSESSEEDGEDSDESEESEEGDSSSSEEDDDEDEDDDTDEEEDEENEHDEEEGEYEEEEGGEEENEEEDGGGEEFEEEEGEENGAELLVFQNPPRQPQIFQAIPVNLMQRTGGRAILAPSLLQPTFGQRNSPLSSPSFL